MRMKVKMHTMIKLPLDSSGLGILMLSDFEQTRTLGIPCDKPTYDFFFLHYSNYNELTSKAIPEVLWGILKERGLCNFEIDIKDNVDGEYVTDLVSLDTGSRYPMRVSDALLLAHIGELPIYIEENMMCPASGPEEFQINGLASILRLVESPLLKEMLPEALRIEDYELASAIRDELCARGEQLPKS